MTSFPEGTQLRQLSNGGGTDPVWAPRGSYDVSPDGRLLTIPAPPPTTTLRIVLDWSYGLDGGS